MGPCGVESLPCALKRKSIYKLRSISHTVKLTLLNCGIQRFKTVCKIAQPSPPSNSTMFSSSEKETSLSLHLPFSLPLEPDVCFPSLCICRFWIFHRNGIIQYMTFVSGLFTGYNIFKVHPCCINIRTPFLFMAR